MKLQFDINNNVEDFTIVLSTRGYEHYGEICNVKRDSVNCKRNMNASDELSFEVYKTLDNKDERLWDDIKDFKLVWVKELNEYFEIYVSFDDSITPMKTVTCTSLCEAELGQTNLYGVEIRTDADINRENYVDTVFYNPDEPKGSLLHRVLEKAPHYSIKYVDESLWNIKRSFSIDGTDIYSWLTGECSEQFNCLFLFDSTDRSISVYDLYTVCRDCGHRGEYNDACPECGGTDLKYYGEDTTIFVDKENLTESVKLEADAGSIKNCFKLEAGDDDMTAAVINANPNGTSYIYYVTDEQKEDMPDELVEKIESYDALVASYTEEYEQLAEDIYQVIDDIYFYKLSMMPTFEKAEITASTEAAKLKEEILSPVALPQVTESTMKATVENALLNYAKLYVKTGYVKLEINQSEFAYIREDFGQWTGNFKVTNYSNEEDIAESEIITVDIGGGAEYYETFLRQKIMKSITDDDDDEGSLFNVLAEEDIDEFKTFLQDYCLTRLQSFADAIQGALYILIQADQASEEADLYSVLYEPYYAKLEACNNEMNVRSATITELENRYNELIGRRDEIQKALNFEAYLGEEFYPIFCSYRREDTYSNANYISDGLDNAGIFDRARKFMKVAKEELYKAAQPKRSISTTLYNLLAMPEFQVIVDKFDLGNWIRVGVDGNIYRLRLLSYEINFGDIQTLNVEFSDLTKQMGCVSDIQSVISSAQSMATNYSYISKQAEKGNEASESLTNVVDNGLNSSLVQIKNNTNEEVTYGKHGILCRSYDDMIDDYSPEQLKITHNILVFTEDNWKTSSLGLGKHQYTYFDGSKFANAIGYGLSAKFLQSPYVYGGQIISGDIYSDNYSSTTGTHINLTDGTFSFGGGALTYDGKTLSISSPSIPEKVSDLKNDSGYTNTSQVTTITKNTVTTDYVNALDITAKSVSTDWVYAGNIKAGQIKTGSITSTDGVTTKINLDDGTFNIGKDALTWNGSLLTVTGKITTNDILVTGGSININNKFIVDQDGNVTIPSGTITLGEINGASDLATKTYVTGLGYQTASQVTTITNNTIKTTNVVAENLTVKATHIDGQLTASQINTTGLIAENISGTTIEGKTISGGSLLIGNKSGNYAEITPDGILKCSGAEIDAKVALAKGSSIGGMKADSNSIFGNGSAITDANPSWSSITKGFAFMCPGGTNTKISLGNSSKMSGWVFGCYPHFGVTSEGNIYGTKAYFNSVKDDGAEIRIIDENTNNITFKGDSIKMSYTGYNGELRATGLYFSSVTLDGVAGELTLGGQTLTESALEKLLELI